MKTTYRAILAGSVGQPSYPAVEVVSRRGTCPAVAELSGKLFLASDAPRLPLSNCNRPEHCDCRYQKYPDRRMGGDDRRFPYFGQRAGWFAGEEKRATNGRRKDD